MEKDFWESKTVWGFVGFSLFGILNVFYPNPWFASATVASLGWAGFGFRDAIDY